MVGREDGMYYVVVKANPASLNEHFESCCRALGMLRYFFLNIRTGKKSLAIVLKTSIKCTGIDQYKVQQGTSIIL